MYTKADRSKQNPKQAAKPGSNAIANSTSQKKKIGGKMDMMQNFPTLQAKQAGSAFASSFKQQPSPKSPKVSQRAYNDVLDAEAKARAMKLFGVMVRSKTQRDQYQQRIWAEQQNPVVNQERLAMVTQVRDNARDAYDQAYQVLRVFYHRSAGAALTHPMISPIVPWDVSEEHALAAHFIAGARALYAEEGQKQFDRAESQDELLLGNREEVGAMQEVDKILDTNIWSWGVNQAFIEGGASNKAEFALVTAIGDQAKINLSYMDGKAFLDSIKPSQLNPAGLHRNLWHSGDNRPTWYALELAGLLDIGYRISEDETKMEPPEETDDISHSVEGTGTHTYLRTEGIV